MLNKSHKEDESNGVVVPHSKRELLSWPDGTSHSGGCHAVLTESTVAPVIGTYKEVLYAVE